MGCQIQPKIHKPTSTQPILDIMDLEAQIYTAVYALYDLILAEIALIEQKDK